MLEFNDQEKKELKQEIGLLNFTFNEIAFIKLFHKFKAFITIGYFEPVESWLIELSETNPITKGLLAMIYLELHDWDNAMEMAAETQKIFHNTEIWSKIIKAAICEKFKEPRQSKPT